MFLEKSKNHSRTGWIEVICGSMFSGKTEELIRRLKRARIAKQRVEIFKPIIDDRYDRVNIVSHDDSSIHSMPVANSHEILDYAEGFEVLGIDEAQFFDEDLINICNRLANNGLRVIVAGLDMDYQGNPFGPIPRLLSTAEFVTKVHAICIECGELANYSYRKAEGESLIKLGEKDHYEPLCRKHFLEKMKKTRRTTS